MHANPELGSLKVEGDDAFFNKLMISQTKTVMRPAQETFGFKTKWNGQDILFYSMGSKLITNKKWEIVKGSPKDTPVSTVQ